MARKLNNWLKALAEYVEETESPRQFWLWSGLFTIAAAVQRKVSIPFGMSPVYPNLYIMLIAPPAVCRKSVPIKFSKQILGDIDVPIFADSASKRAITKHMDQLAKVCFFRDPKTGKMETHCSTTFISAEMSSFLAVDPKGVIEFLTDAFDCADKWDYSTSGQGEDILYNVCPNAQFATTPRWMADNLPEGSIGGGWTSRVLMVVGTDKYKLVPRPPKPNEALYRKLKLDLQHISQIVGEFRWESDTEEYFDEWYNKTLPNTLRTTKDDRLHSFIGRMHIHALKVAMCLRLAYSDDLVLNINDLGRSIDLVHSVLDSAGDALSGHGRSKTSADVDRVIRQLRVLGKVSLSELMRMNLHDLNLPEMLTVLESIEAMGIAKIERYHDTLGRERIKEIVWIGGAEKGKGGKPNIKKRGESNGSETKKERNNSKRDKDI